MPDATPRHLRLADMFSRGSGLERYARTILEGPTYAARTEMAAYFALYEDGDFPYMEVTSAAPRPDIARREALSLRYPEATAREESRRAGAVLISSPDIVNATLWELGTRQVGHPDLPIVLLAWMRIVQNGKRQIMLYYPSLTQGPWALKRLQGGMRRRRDR